MRPKNSLSPTRGFGLRVDVLGSVSVFQCKINLLKGKMPSSFFLGGSIGITKKRQLSQSGKRE
jgi:hypothetical protein